MFIAKLLAIVGEAHLLELTLEGRVIQQQSCNVRKQQDEGILWECHFAHSFARLMFIGNTKGTLTLLLDHP